MAIVVWGAGSGAGTDGLYSTAANWTSDTKPVSGDTATFNGGVVINCRLDESIVAGVNIDMQAAYTGTIDGATDDLNHACTDVTLDGTRVDMGDGTWTISGNFDNKDVTTFNRNLSTIVLAGTGKTVNQGDDFYNLTVSGTYTVTSTFFDTVNDVVISGTLTIDAGRIMRLKGATAGELSVTGSGLITGGGSLKPKNGFSIVQQDGTIDIDELKFEGEGTVVPATYVSPFTFTSTSNKTFTPSAGVYNFSNGLTINSEGAGQLTWAGNVNDPTINVTGDVLLELLGTSTIVSMGDGTWTCSGNWDSDTVTTLNANLSTLKFANAGSGTQTIKLGSFTYNIIEIDDSGATKQLTGPVTAASWTGTAGVFDMNGQTMTTTANFTRLAADSLTFADLSGVALVVSGTFDIKGNSEADKLDMKGTSSWTLNASASDVKFVDVQNSDASAGITIAADKSTDSGGNVNWDFIIMSPFMTPFGDPLFAVFTNPHEAVSQ